MTRCPSHCDHCAPDDFHSCRRPKGHRGFHSCTPSDRDTRDDAEDGLFDDVGEVTSPLLLALAVTLILALLVVALTSMGGAA